MKKRLFFGYVCVFLFGLFMTSSVFAAAVCGNFILEESEQCEDGNLDGSDGCDQCYYVCPVTFTCGDGDLNTGEECDFGTANNNNATFSSSLINFAADPTAPAACSSKTSYVCSASCEATQVLRTTPSTSKDLEMRIFLDSNDDNLDDTESGLNNIDVDLYEINATTGVVTNIGTDDSGSGTFPRGTFPFRDGVVSISGISINPLNEYFFRIDKTQTEISAMTQVTPNVGADEGIDSDGVANTTTLVDAPINFDLSCDIDGLVQVGFELESDVCGDGFQTGEELEAGRCEDGNVVSGDGCSSSCVVEYCGDAYVDSNGIDNIPGNSDDEVCDFGTSYNDGTSQSTINSGGFVQFVSGNVNVCQSQTYHTCSADCKTTTSNIFEQPRIQSVSIDVFNDTDDGDGVDDSPFNGFDNVEVTLFEDKSGLITELGSATTNVNWALGQDGKATVSNQPFYSGRTYYIEVDATTGIISNYASTTHSGTGGIYQVGLAVNACNPEDSGIGFEVQPYCGDGKKNQVTEECDYGSSRNDGTLYSLNQETWIDGSSPAVCTYGFQYTCTPTCQNGPTNFYAIPETSEVVAHAYYDDDNSGNADKIWPISDGIDDLDINVYEDTGFTKTLISTVETSSSGLVASDSKHTIDIYPNRNYTFEVITTSANYLAQNISPTVASGDNDARVEGTRYIANLSIDYASCVQVDKPTFFGFVYNGYCGDGNVNVGESCDFGSPYNDGSSRSLSSVSWDNSSKAACSVGVEYTCRSDCSNGLSYPYSIPSSSERLVAHAFNDTDGNGNSDDGAFGSVGLNGLSIDLYEEKSGVRTLLISNITQSSFPRNADAHFYTDVYPDKDYFFVVNTSASNYQSLAIQPTQFIGDNEATQNGVLLEAQIPLDASCSQFNTPVEFGFIGNGYCGDGKVNQIGEVCDFGATNNNGVAQSSTQLTWTAYTPGPVCTDSTAYTCDATCQPGPSITQEVINTGQVVEMRVFNDTNLNNISDEFGNGLNGVTITLVENNSDGVETVIGTDVSALGTFPTLPANGVIAITGDINKSNQYFFVADLTQSSLSDLIPVEPNVGGNDGSDSDAIRDNTRAIAEISFDSACEPTGTIQFGFKTKTTLCGDGVVDPVEGEQCDFGSFNGQYSLDSSTYIPFESAAVCQLGVNRYSCDSSCQLTTETADTFCPTCTDGDFVACSENASTYITGQTYTESASVTSSFCGHDGLSWGWQSGMSDLDDYQNVAAEICSGGVNSIDQNCNAHLSFERYANGSVNYNSYSVIEGTFNVKKDIDAFDSACMVSLSGYISDVNTFPLSNVVINLYIVSESNSDQYYTQTTTDSSGYYEFTNIPATSYTIFPSKTNYNSQAKTVDLTTYNANYQENFTLVDGNCRSDCTTGSNPILCDASCDGLNQCNFFNTTIAQRLDGIRSGVSYFDEDYNLTMFTCEGAPIEGDKTSSGINTGGIACPEGKTLVINEKTVLYNGRPVVLKVALCTEE